MWSTLGPAVAMVLARGEVTEPPREHLHLWLEADAGVEREGEQVVVWHDQSGHGRDAVAEPGGRPVWLAEGLNGRPAVRFDGARSALAVPHSPELNATGGFTVICVYRYSGGFRLAQKKSNHGGIGPDAWFLTPNQGLVVSGRFQGRQWFQQNRVNLQTSIFDAAAGTVRAFGDGEAKGEMAGVPPQRPNEDPLYLGKRALPAGTEGHLQGELAELLLYDVALPDEARLRVEGYLRAKYDIRPIEQPGIETVRVIPGKHRVTVEWLPARTDVPPEQLEYRVAIKLRDEPWDRARVVTLSGDARSVSFEGLLNHADHTVRVTAHRLGAGEQVAASFERLVSPAEVPGVVIDYLHKDDPAYLESGQYLGSPSIARLPDGALVAGHDIFGQGSDDHSRVFRSDDDGDTWYHTADVRPAFWPKLFVHRGKLYSLATSTQYGDLVLHESTDGGFTWRGPAVIAPGTYHKAPMPVVEHNGRLWTCVELQTGTWPAGFQAVCASVPADADLMEPNHWLVSEPLAYDPAWQPEGWDLPVTTQGFLEGNFVVDPQGRMLDILRYNTTPHYGKAVVLRIADDGRSLSFDQVIDFPGGMTKFTIRRHPATGVYWSLVNRVTVPGAAGQRSVLSLARSEDALHWTVVRDVLRDDREFAVRYTGFQYVDWLFDGADLLVASRTAFNGAHNFHDANHLTFHRVPDFQR